MFITRCRLFGAALLCTAVASAPAVAQDCTVTDNVTGQPVSASSLLPPVGEPLFRTVAQRIVPQPGTRQVVVITKFAFVKSSEAFTANLDWYTFRMSMETRGRTGLVLGGVFLNGKRIATNGLTISDNGRSFTLNKRGVGLGQTTTVRVVYKVLGPWKFAPNGRVVLKASANSQVDYQTSRPTIVCSQTPAVVNKPTESTVRITTTGKRPPRVTG